MKVVGLTGGIGSGKSYVAKIFAGFGAKIIDADEVCRGIYEPGGACLDEVTKAFGRQILRADGTLDRGALGGIVFSDRAALDRLNKIAHKYIIQKIEETIDRFIKDKDQVVIIDAPQLYEAGMDARCDAVIAVTAPMETRLARIKARDGVSEQQAKERISMQYDDEFFAGHADYIIRNADGDPVREQAARIYQTLTEE